MRELKREENRDDRYEYADSRNSLPFLPIMILIIVPCFFIDYFLDYGANMNLLVENYEIVILVIVIVILILIAYLIFSNIRSNFSEEINAVCNTLKSILYFNMYRLQNKSENIDLNIDVYLKYGYSPQELSLKNILNSTSRINKPVMEIYEELIPEYLKERSKDFSISNIDEIVDSNLDNFDYFVYLISQYVKFSISEVRNRNLKQFSKEIKFDWKLMEENMSYSLFFSMFFGLCEYWKKDAKKFGLIKFKNLDKEFYRAFKPRMDKQYSIDYFCESFAYFVLIDKWILGNKMYIREIDFLYNFQEFVFIREDIRRSILKMLDNK